ncbi:virB8 family protein [Paraburkholderia sp. BCC1885]|uniref:virB8 family protein n=1 Tax=Paraburkholderia sp. BCC1885 TaxID=2562669 RepID=UPI001183B635|nr:type IV secretion system protein [Paraburkholderia sp. BCC1885]
MKPDTTTRDYRRVLDTEASLTDLTERSERRAWHVAYVACVVAALCAAGLAIMAPFYRVVPLPIEVDRLTGEAQVIDVLDAKHVHAGDIQDRHWVDAYVQSRERYVWGLLQMDYDSVLTMSDDAVARDYRQIYGGPDALDRQLGADTERHIRILSTTLPPDEPGHAVVHIERTTRKHGIDNAEPPVRFVITLAYTYRPPVFTRESVAISNPLGFRVTAYSRDPEYTPPVASAGGAGKAGVTSGGGSQ